MIVLARVVTELGTVQRVTPKTIESLFVSDFGYLQDLYRIINFQDPSILDALEPGTPFPHGVRGGGLGHYAQDELWQEIAYLAYHLHWDLDRLLDLEHGDRIRLLQEVGGLNERAWQGVQGG